MTITISDDQAQDIKEWVSEQLEYASLEPEYADRLQELLQIINEAEMSAK